MIILSHHHIKRIRFAEVYSTSPININKILDDVNDATALTGTLELSLSQRQLYSQSHRVRQAT